MKRLVAVLVGAFVGGTILHPTIVLSQDIQARCAKEWPDDFRMREFCEKQQTEGAGKLNDRSMSSNEERMIRAKCEQDWGTDYRMRNYCEERQLEAMRALGIKPSNAS